MQILLNQKEIEKAIVDFVSQQGISISGTHIEVTLVAGDNELSAAINISKEPLKQTPVLEGPTGVVAGHSGPVGQTGTPDQTEDVDREAIKAELGRLGVEFAPKAHTSTLQTLLEEARAKQNTFVAEPAPETKVAEPVRDTGSLFGQPSAPKEEDTPPFNIGTEEKAKEPKEEPVKEPEVPEEDNRPLFGR